MWFCSTRLTSSLRRTNFSNWHGIESNRVLPSNGLLLEFQMTVCQPNSASMARGDYGISSALTAFFDFQRIMRVTIRFNCGNCQFGICKEQYLVKIVPKLLTRVQKRRRLSKIPLATGSGNGRMRSVQYLLARTALRFESPRRLPQVPQHNTGEWARPAFNCFTESR